MICSKVGTLNTPPESVPCSIRSSVDWGKGMRIFSWALLLQGQATGWGGGVGRALWSSRTLPEACVVSSAALSLCRAGGPWTAQPWCWEGVAAWEGLAWGRCLHDQVRPDWSAVSVVSLGLKLGLAPSPEAGKTVVVLCEVDQSLKPLE